MMRLDEWNCPDGTRRADERDGHLVLNVECIDQNSFSWRQARGMSNEETGEFVVTRVVHGGGGYHEILQWRGAGRIDPWTTSVFRICICV
jgi:hypothetical protein